MWKRDGTEDCFLHKIPRNSDPNYWGMRQYYEVTLMRNNHNVFDVYVEWRYKSDKKGTMIIDCWEDRLPVTELYTRGSANSSTGEGVVYLDQNPDSPNSNKVCSADRPPNRPKDLRLNLVSQVCSADSSISRPKELRIDECFDSTRDTMTADQDLQEGREESGEVGEELWDNKR